MTPHNITKPPSSNTRYGTNIKTTPCIRHASKFASINRNMRNFAELKAKLIEYANKKAGGIKKPVQIKMQLYPSVFHRPISAFIYLFIYIYRR